MKKSVKATISFFRLLIEHSQKEYEPFARAHPEENATATLPQLLGDR